MKDTIKTVIVDDDPLSIGKLADDLKTFPGIKVLDTATSADKARRIIVDLQPNLLFLDIEMPGISGIDLLREIQSEIHPDMRIIFYTAHDKYFRNAMLVSDFDYYLLKPYLPEELSIAIKRIRAKESKMTVEALLQKIIMEKRFAIQTVTSLKILTYEEVVFFEYPKSMRSWQVYLVDKQIIPLRSTITSKDILSINPNFIQINQRCVVNLTHLAKIENRTLKCDLNDYPFEQEISPQYYRGIKKLLGVL